jgi:hypothetical protein
MFLEEVGSASLRLILDNGKQEIVASDVGALSGARERIKAFTGRFSKLTAVKAESVAAPGRDCAACQIRPGCAAYLTAASAWWADVPDEVAPEPPDTWGEVTRVIETRTGVTVHLTDAANRGVKVDRLDPRHGIGQQQVGRQLWLFNLCPDNRRRGFSGQRPHPRLFHELPHEDGGGERAWDVGVFV